MTVNQFTGCSMATLKQRLKRNLRAVEEISNDPDGAGGGSRLESIYDRIDDIKAEIERRTVLTKPEQS